MPEWHRVGFRSSLPEHRRSLYLGFRCARSAQRGEDPNLELDEQLRLPASTIDESEAIRQLLTGLFGPGRRPLAPPVQQVLAALPAGAVVGDVGCGLGALSLQIARLVGPQGRVLAVDIDPGVLAFLAAAAAAEGLGNIEPVRARPDDLTLAPASADLLLLYEMANSLPPEFTAGFVRGLVRALRPGGLLVIHESAGSPPPRAVLDELVGYELAAQPVPAASAAPRSEPGAEEGDTWIFKAPD